MERSGGSVGGNAVQQRRVTTLGELKYQAAEYYRSNEVPQRLEEVLNAMFYLRPDDFYGHLANYFSGLSKPPEVCRLTGNRLMDGTARPTLEVEVFCVVKNFDKRICSSTISSHAEILESFSPEAFDSDERELNESVNTAIQWITESLDEKLRGLEPTDQQKADELLCEYFAKKAEEEKERRKTEKEKEKEAPEVVVPITPPPPPPGKKKSNKPGKKQSIVEKPIPPAEPSEPPVKGSMAIGCISLAVAKAAATIREIPLYLHISLLKHSQDLPKELFMPLPMISVLSCGKSSPGKLNLMKEIILIPPVWLTVKQAIERCLDIQKQVMKLTESMVKAPPPTESKKSSAKDGGKKAPQPVLKKVSHLGCLVLGCESLEQPLNLINTACTNLSLELGIDMYLGINCAAHEFIDYSKRKYEIMTGTYKNADEMVDVYEDMINKFPYIIALIDPLRKEDRLQWTILCNILGPKCHLLAEDSCRNVSKLLEDKHKNGPKCSGLILKYTNEMTISSLLGMTQFLHGLRHICVLGSPDGECSDDSLVDLAVGLGIKFIKLGGLSRGERVNKYNRLCAIEEELFKNGRLCEREANEFVDFIEEDEEEEEEFEFSDATAAEVPSAV